MARLTYQTYNAHCDITEKYTDLYDKRRNYEGKSSHHTSGTLTISRPDKRLNAKSPTGYRSPSPYHLTTSSQQYITAKVKGAHRGWGNDGYHDLTLSGEMIGSINMLNQANREFMEQSKDALRLKILTNIKDEVLDVAMVLAEMRGTATTLANGIYRVARSLDSIRLRRPENFRYLMHGTFGSDRRRPTDKFLRETAGIFLEWKYGIMPTLYDIEGATKALDMNTGGNSQFDNPPLLVARSTHKADETRSTSIGFQRQGNSYFYGDCSIEYKHMASARCDYEVDGDALRGLSQYGIGLGTVATIALERTPFMFVVNMAFPIIDLIKAWTALAGVSVVGYTETYYTQPVCQAGSVKFDQPGSKNKPYLGKWESTPLQSFFTRNTYGTPPMPMPFVRNPIKIGNAATILALLTQLRKPEAIAPVPSRKRPSRKPKVPYLPPLEYL